MSGSARLSRGELVALVEQQARVIEELRAEVAKLKRRLGQNSQPPSADGPAAGGAAGLAAAQWPADGQAAGRGRCR